MNNIVVVGVDVGVLGYILLYSLTLYNVSDETLADWRTPDKDRKQLKQVKLHGEEISGNMISHYRSEHFLRQSM